MGRMGVARRRAGKAVARPQNGRKFGPDVLTDHELMWEACLRAKGRSELSRKKHSMYRELQARELIDRTFGIISSYPRNRGLIEEIVSMAREFEKEGKLEEKKALLTPRRRQVLECILADPEKPEQKMAKELGFSKAALTFHKKEIISGFGRPLRHFTKYAHFTDGRIRGMIERKGAKNMEAIRASDAALYAEIKYREKHEGKDFSGPLLKNKYRSEELCAAITRWDEVSDAALELLSEEDWKVLLNAISPQPQHPRALGLETSDYARREGKLIRYLWHKKLPRPPYRSKSFRKTAQEVLKTGHPDYILDLAGLDEVGRAIFWGRGVEDPPLPLSEIGAQFDFRRSKMGHLQGKVEENLRAALEDAYPGPVRTARHMPHYLVYEERLRPLIPHPGEKPERRADTN